MGSVSENVWQPKNVKKSELSFTSSLTDEQENEVIFSKSLIELMGNHERDHRFPNPSFGGFSLDQTAAEESLDESLRLGKSRRHRISELALPGPAQVARYNRDVNQTKETKFEALIPGRTEKLIRDYRDGFSSTH